MPQELCTLRYFRALGLAPDTCSPGDLERRVRDWLDRPGDYERYRARFRAARTEDEPEALVRAILGVEAPHPATLVDEPRTPAQ